MESHKISPELRTPVLYCRGPREGRCIAGQCTPASLVSVLPACRSVGWGVMATNRNGQEPPTTMWDIALPSRWRSRRRGSSNSSTMMNGNSSSSRSVPSQDFELQRNKDRRQSHQHLALKRGDYTNTTTTRSGHHHRGSALPRQTSTKKFGIRKKHKV